MKIIYVHHADINYNDKEKVQLEENLLVEKLANIKASAIYTSTDPSCKHTAELLKKKLKRSGKNARNNTESI